MPSVDTSNFNPYPYRKSDGSKQGGLTDKDINAIKGVRPALNKKRNGRSALHRQIAQVMGPLPGQTDPKFKKFDLSSDLYYDSDALWSMFTPEEKEELVAMFRRPGIDASDPKVVENYVGVLMNKIIEATGDQDFRKYRQQRGLTSENYNFGDPQMYGSDPNLSPIDARLNNKPSGVVRENAEGVRNFLKHTLKEIAEGRDTFGLPFNTVSPAHAHQFGPLDKGKNTIDLDTKPQREYLSAVARKIAMDDPAGYRAALDKATKKGVGGGKIMVDYFSGRLADPKYSEMFGFVVPELLAYAPVKYLDGFPLEAEQIENVATPQELDQAMDYFYGKERFKYNSPEAPKSRVDAFMQQHSATASGIADPVPKTIRSLAQMKGWNDIPYADQMKYAEALSALSAWQGYGDDMAYLYKPKGKQHYWGDFLDNHLGYKVEKRVPGRSYTTTTFGPNGKGPTPAQQKMDFLNPDGTRNYTYFDNEIAKSRASANVVPEQRRPTHLTPEQTQEIFGEVDPFRMAYGENLDRYANIAGMQKGYKANLSRAHQNTRNYGLAEDIGALNTYANYGPEYPMVFNVLQSEMPQLISKTAGEKVGEGVHMNPKGVRRKIVAQTANIGNGRKSSMSPELMKKLWILGPMMLGYQAYNSSPTNAGGLTGPLAEGSNSVGNYDQYYEPQTQYESQGLYGNLASGLPKVFADREFPDYEIPIQKQELDYWDPRRRD